MNDLTQLLRENFEFLTTNLHTAFPGTVVKYDANTRRADIQPSVKRKLPSGEFAELPVIPDVPVLYPGTKKYTIHFPLEKDDEVLCVIMERGTDVWRDKGGAGHEEADPRRFNLMDCIAIAGLQPKEFIVADAGEGLTVIHKSAYNGDFISSVAMNDGKMELKYKKLVTCTVTDGGIELNNEKDSKAAIKGDDTKSVKGDCSLKVEGNIKNHSDGTTDVESVGDFTLSVNNGTATVVVGADGSIAIKAPSGININTPTINVTGEIITGGDVIISGKSFLGHTHTGVHGITTPPN